MSYSITDVAAMQDAAFNAASKMSAQQLREVRTKINLLIQTGAPLSKARASTDLRKMSIELTSA